jgi:hypothetical protein
MFSISHINPKWLRYLPPQLLHLTVEMLSTSPNTQQLASLPQGLNTLRLDIEPGVLVQGVHCPWTDQTFAAPTNAPRFLNERNTP